MSLSQFQKRRRQGLAVLLVAAFAALLTVRSAWGETGHETIEAVGLGLILVGILGRIWCTLYIGGRKSMEIVETGPYSLSRNPLYVFSSIAAAGVGAQTGSLVLAAVFFAGCALAFHYVILREEGFLIGAFGQPYEQYRMRVPRFWPKFSRFRDEASISVPTSRIYATLADGLVFLIALPAFEFIEYLQGIGRIAVQFRIY